MHYAIAVSEHLQLVVSTTLPSRPNLPLTPEWHTRPEPLPVFISSSPLATPRSVVLGPVDELEFSGYGLAEATNGVRRRTPTPSELLLKVQSYVLFVRCSHSSIYSFSVYFVDDL